MKKVLPASLRLPFVIRFEELSRNIAREPRFRIGVAAQVGVPKRGAEREDDAMMIRIAFLGFSGKRSVAECGVLGLVQHEFVFVARWQRGEHGQP